MSGEFAPSRVMPLVKAMGAPDAGNPHVRCDEGGGGAFTPPLYSIGEFFFRAREADQRRWAGILHTGMGSILCRLAA